MTEFTPIMSLLGGMMIGLAAVLLMAFNGRIAGCSGIGSSVLPPWTERLSQSDLGWRIAFIVGLIAAPLIVQLSMGQKVPQLVSSNGALMIAAGLLTGFGSVYGGGCTSGHGVCGMSRLSVRSLVATAIFMFVAFLTVFFTRHVFGA